MSGQHSGQSGQDAQAELDVLLAALEAERPQREAELAALLAQLEGKDDSGATRKR